MKCPCCDHKISVMSIPADDRYTCSQCGTETRLANCLVSLNDFMFWYVSKNGIGSLQDSRKVIAYAKDLVPKKKTEIIDLSDALNGNVVHALINGNAVRFNKNQSLLNDIVNMLKNEQFMTEQEALTTAGYFSSGLGWEVDLDTCEDAFVELLPTKTVDELIESARDYAFGYEKDRDYTKVKQCLEVAAKKGSTYAMRALAKALAEDLIKDHNSVEYWYSMAIDNGSILAYGELFTFYLTTKQFDKMESIMQRIADQNIFYSIAAASPYEFWAVEYMSDILNYTKWLFEDAERRKKVFEEYVSIIDMNLSGAIGDTDLFKKSYCHHVFGTFVGLTDYEDFDKELFEQALSLWKDLTTQGVEKNIPVFLSAYPVVAWLYQPCPDTVKDNVKTYLCSLPSELAQWSEYFYSACVEKKAYEYKSTPTSFTMVNSNEVDEQQNKLVIPLAQAGNEWAHSHYIKYSIKYYSMAFEGVKDIILQFPYALDEFIKCIPSLITQKEYEKALRIFSTLTFEEQAVSSYLPQILEIYCRGFGGEERFEKALDLLEYRFNSDLSCSGKILGFSERNSINALEFAIRMINHSIRTVQYSDGISRLKKAVRLRLKINEVFEQHYSQERANSDLRSEDLKQILGAPVIDRPLGVVAFYLMNVYCFGVGVPQSLEKAKEYYDYAQKTGVTINWDTQTGSDEFTFTEAVILAKFDYSRYQKIRNSRGDSYYAAEGIVAYLNKDFQNAYNCLMRALGAGGINGGESNKVKQYSHYYFALLLSDCQLEGKFDYDKVRTHLNSSYLAGNIFAIPRYVYRLFMDGIALEPVDQKQWFAYVSVMAKVGISEAKVAAYFGIHNNIVNEQLKYPNKEKWYDYLKEAYEAGCPLASDMVNLHLNRASACFHGTHGMIQNLSVAFEDYYKIAYCGHPAGQSNLGIMYWRGWGVPANLTEAEKWLKTAAESSNSSAVSALLQFYLEQSMKYMIPSVFEMVENWQEDDSKLRTSHKLLNCEYGVMNKYSQIANGAVCFLKENQMVKDAATLLKTYADLLLSYHQGKHAANYAVYLYNSVGLKEAYEYAQKAQQAGFENDTTKSIINYVRIQEEIQSEKRVIADSKRELGTLGFFAGRRKGELNAQIKKSEEKIQNLERTLRNTTITASYT